MLVSEKKLSHADGVLLWPADRGLNYQTAGAFQRLGGRLMGVVKSGEKPLGASPLPIKLHEWSAGTRPETVFGEVPTFKTLIWAPHPALSWSEAPSDDEVEAVIDTVRYAAEADPEFHAVFVLSQRCPRELLVKLRSANERATILLSPLAFGFRDESLFDASLAILKKNPAFLLKTSKDSRFAEPIQAVSFADLAAHLIVSPHNERLIGKNIWVHGAEWTLLEWQKIFAQSFAARPSGLQRLSSSLSFAETFPESLIARVTAPRPNNTSTPSPTLDFVVHSDQELFPSPSPQLRRSLDQHSRAFERYPELELVFTPSRNP